MTVLMSKSRFPTRIGEPSSYFYAFVAESATRPAVDAIIQGVVSKAKVTVSSYFENPDRVRLSFPINGQGGDQGIPILPNERLEQVGDTAKWLDMASTHKKSSSSSSTSGQDEVAA